MSRHVVQVRLREVVILYGLRGEIEIFLPESHSLKDRRKTVNSLKTRLHANHNMSVADISEDHIWQRARLAFALVGSSMKGLQETLDAVDRLLISYSDFEVISFDFDFFPPD